MKKVRFESPLKSYKVFEMNENECHSPRPFIERQVSIAPSFPLSENVRIVPYNPNPVHTYEYGNLSPFPNVTKTRLQNIDNIKNRWAHSNDLDLSILDSSNSGSQNISCRPHEFQDTRKPLSVVNKKLSENNLIKSPPNVLNKTDDFFLRRENISKLQLKDGFYSQFNKLSLDKENDPLCKKMEIINKSRYDSQSPCEKQHVVTNASSGSLQNMRCTNCLNSPLLLNGLQYIPNLNICQCTTEIQNHPPCTCIMQSRSQSKQICYNSTSKPPSKNIPENSVDKKKWVIEKLEQPNKENCTDIDKVKREPTVSDLFKIIKLQNEQLQMLQEKVDKLISDKQESKPVTQYMTTHVLQSVEDQKMSIGVMTSFELVRTSTIINKEIVTQNEAQIQCNRSQISIKEVVSKSQPNQINFLDGIPVTNDKVPSEIHNSSSYVQEKSRNVTKETEGVADDKTYNELSLYNVQVDNATTPLMSPEQSLYLDVRDYSDSDSGSDDQSNVGWTYYNKVMTHVNGMLHESDMPSSASALYRNTRQKCLQMQIDKTNVSVAKRVTFGDDPLGMQQQNLNVAVTDTSLKMNQLAAKYLKSRPILMKSPSPKLINYAQTEMSYATRNYMEKHKLLQGTSSQKRGVEIPKFLDITALKQQPKLL